LVLDGLEGTGKENETESLVRKKSSRRIDETCGIGELNLDFSGDVDGLDPKANFASTREV